MEKLRKTHLRMADIAAIVDELKYNSIVPREYTPDLSKLRIRNCVTDLGQYKAKTEASRK